MQATKEHISGGLNYTFEVMLIRHNIGTID